MSAPDRNNGKGKKEKGRPKARRRSSAPRSSSPEANNTVAIVTMRKRGTSRSSIVLNDSNEKNRLLKAGAMRPSTARSAGNFFSRSTGATLRFTGSTTGLGGRELPADNTDAQNADLQPSTSKVSGVSGSGSVVGGGSVGGGGSLGGGGSVGGGSTNNHCKCGSGAPRKPQEQTTPPPQPPLRPMCKCSVCAVRPQQNLPGCGPSSRTQEQTMQYPPPNYNAGQCRCSVGPPRGMPEPMQPQYGGQYNIYGGQCRCSSAPTPMPMQMPIRQQCSPPNYNDGQCRCGSGPMQRPMSRPDAMQMQRPYSMQMQRQMPQQFSNPNGNGPCCNCSAGPTRQIPMGMPMSPPNFNGAPCNCQQSVQQGMEQSSPPQRSPAPSETPPTVTPRPMPSENAPSERPMPLENDVPTAASADSEDCSCPLRLFADKEPGETITIPGDPSPNNEVDCSCSLSRLNGDSDGPPALIGVLKIANDEVSFNIWRTPQFVKVGGERAQLDTLRPQRGWVEQDANQILAQSFQVINKMCCQLQADKIDLTEIKALAILNEPDTFVTWDVDSKQPLYNAILSRDKRTEPMVDELIQRYGEDYFQQQTGLPIATYFVATKLRWLLENVKEVETAGLQGTLRVGTLESWIVWNLTEGDVHVTDCTNAARTMLMNIKTLKWEPTLLKEFKVQEFMLPEIYSNAEEYGLVSNPECVLLNVPISCLIAIPNSKLIGTFAIDTGQAVTGNDSDVTFLLCNTGTNCIFDKNGLITTVAYQMGANADIFYALGGAVPSAKKLLQIVGQNPQTVPTASNPFVSNPRASGSPSIVQANASPAGDAGRNSIADAVRASINRRLSNGPAFFATPRNSENSSQMGSIRASVRNSIQNSLRGSRLVPETTSHSSLQRSSYQPSSAMFIPASDKLYQPTPATDNVGHFEDINGQTTSQDIENALIESQVFQKTAMVDAAKADGTPVRSIHATGELAQNDEHMQLEADITNIEVVKPSSGIPDEYGAIIMAALAEGLVKLTPERIHQLEGEPQSFYPQDNERTRALRDRYKKWKSAVKKKGGSGECMMARMPGFHVLPLSLQQLLCGNINDDNFIWLEGLIAGLLLLFGLLWLRRLFRGKAKPVLRRSCNCCRLRKRLF